MSLSLNEFSLGRREEFLIERVEEFHSQRHLEEPHFGRV